METEDDGLGEVEGELEGELDTEEEGLGDEDGELETDVLGEFDGLLLGDVDGELEGDVDGDVEGELDGDDEGELKAMVSFMFKKESPVAASAALNLSVAVPVVIEPPTFVAKIRRRILSPAAKAVSVGFAVQVSSLSPLENSTPSSKGPPTSSVMVGVPGVYLYIRIRPPALSLLLDSANHPEKSVVVSVNPVPTGLEIHAIVEPPPDCVH